MVTRICAITSSRADYGLLRWLLQALQADTAFELQLLVTGTHLAREFGYTIDDIERDGFVVNSRVEMLLSSDTPHAICTSMALGTAGVSGALLQLQPDLVVVLGDRFEILAAVQACLIHNVPVAHIAGGDTTEGATDESLRHAITKMSHIHLVTNEQSAQRVLQMGEDPHRVHVVGSPGLDQLRRQPLLGATELAQVLGAPLGQQNLLVTFHPVTLEPGQELAQLHELLAALDAQPQGTRLWVTRPNADAGGHRMAQALDRWAADHAGRVQLHTSLGSLRYLSLMAQVDAVVGNSSSGLYEAPSLGVPTVNIGERQRGRLAATSVLHCAAERQAITRAIEQALQLDCRATVNPYGDGHSVGRIVEVLRHLPSRKDLLKKPFHWAQQTTAEINHD